MLLLFLSHFSEKSEPMSTTAYDDTVCESTKPCAVVITTHALPDPSHADESMITGTTIVVLVVVVVVVIVAVAAVAV